MVARVLGTLWVSPDGRAATRKYPWGDGLPVPARSGNWGDASAIYLTPVTISGYQDGARVTANVGSYPANPLGLHDLGGNVQEWTTDRYSIYVVAPDHVGERRLHLARIVVDDVMVPQDGEGLSAILGLIRTALSPAGRRARSAQRPEWLRRDASMSCASYRGHDRL